LSGPFTVVWPHENKRLRRNDINIKQSPSFRPVPLQVDLLCIFDFVDIV